MSRRNHTPNGFNFHEAQHDPHRRPAAVATPPAARSHLLEDRVAIQHREIQALLMDNQRLAATHVVLKQDLALSQQELRQLSTAAAAVKAERDGEIRNVYEKSLQLEDKAREVNVIGVELDQVRADIKRLSVIKQEMTAQLQTANGDLERATKDAQRVPVVKAEIETVMEEIQRGRAAMECEKKNRDMNNEHCKVMEKNTIALAHEIKRLREKLVNAESKARAGVSYAANYGNPDMVYPGAPYPGSYGMHQALGSTAANTQYIAVSGAMPQVPYVKQQADQHM